MVSKLIRLANREQKLMSQIFQKIISRVKMRLDSEWEFYMSLDIMMHYTTIEDVNQNKQIKWKGKYIGTWKQNIQIQMNNRYNKLNNHKQLSWEWKDQRTQTILMRSKLHMIHLMVTLKDLNSSLQMKIFKMLSVYLIFKIKIKKTNNY